MLYAIETAPIADARALLLQFPPGPLLLRSSFVFQNYISEIKALAEPKILGPLWAVACRRVANNDTAEMLDLFLQRGENINGLCGPDGTALHAALAKHDSNRTIAQRDMLDLLMQRGADPNLPGPDGNVLEYLLKRANTHATHQFKYARGHTTLIRFPFDGVAINRRTDPNGRVRGLGLLLTFGATMPLFISGPEYYTYGRVLTIDMHGLKNDYRWAYNYHVETRMPALAAQHGLSALALENQIAMLSLGSWPPTMPRTRMMKIMSTAKPESVKRGINCSVWLQQDSCECKLRYLCWWSTKKSTSSKVNSSNTICLPARHKPVFLSSWYHFWTPR